MEIRHEGERKKRKKEHMDKKRVREEATLMRKMKQHWRILAFIRGSWLVMMYLGNRSIEKEGCNRVAPHARICAGSARH